MTEPSPKPDRDSDSADARSAPAAGPPTKGAGIWKAILFLLAAFALLAWSFKKSYYPELDPDEIAARLGARDAFNGFDIADSPIPLGEILRGGPPADGIRAIDQPTFIAPDKADYLNDDDLVISVTVDSETRAYPHRILVRHEIVNDQIGKSSIAVTYCPLCGTSMVFDRVHEGKKLVFGVSGLLYNSDVLLFDRETRSLWSQLGMRGVSGDFINAPLKWLPSEIMTWRAWRAAYPNGRALSKKTGLNQTYDRSPYEGYEESDGLMVPVPDTRKELKHKAWVLGVMIGDKTKAYPLEELGGKKTLADHLDNIPIRVEYDPARRWHKVTNTASGEDIIAVQAYWFAWQAFYPETLIWQP